MSKLIHFIVIISILFLSPLVSAELPQNWDESKYIPISEIKTEMDAYCLTVLEGAKIEKFPLKILSIIRQGRPGRDMILVVGTDDRFKHLGAIHGCSGSPVYIDGRIAGALSAGWDGSIDPLYLVTPIEYMLTIGEGIEKSITNYNKTSYIEISAPINRQSILQKAMDSIGQKPLSSVQFPIATNISSKACQLMNESMLQSGFVLMQTNNSPQMNSDQQGQSIFAPGGVLCVPLCSGDIRMAVTGTVTDVINDKVYGFGHPFTGITDIELPMAAGTVYTVVATRQTSMKLAGASEIAGTLRFDEESGVAGIIGQLPKLIDLTINVKRFDAAKDKTFNCKVARDSRLTPLILRAAIAGAALYQGDLPNEHSVRYHCDLQLEAGRQIRFDGVSSGQSIMPMANDIFSLTGALLNNPFQPFYPDKIVLDIELTPDNSSASLWEAKIADNIVRPGELLKVSVALKAFRSEPKVYEINLKIPDDCPDGKYPLQICGPEAYQAFLIKASPQRFTVVDAESLLTGFNRVLNIQMDRLYVCLPTVQSGLTVRNAELPNLPASKVLLLADDKRIQPVALYQNFIENSVSTGFITAGTTVIEITVDKNK